VSALDCVIVKKCLLSTADDSVPVSPGVGDGSKVDIGTVAGRVDPKVLLE